MRPTLYRGSSAVYIFNKESAILLDCAEGTYGQLMDHFGNDEKVSQVLLKTKALLITHHHGDHILGIPKLLEERDKLMTKLDHNDRSQLFIAAPRCLIKWLDDFKNKRLVHPESIELIPSDVFNPEKYYYYQNNAYNSQKYRYFEAPNDRKHSDVCVRKDKRKIDIILRKFRP